MHMGRPFDHPSNAGGWRARVASHSRRVIAHSAGTAGDTLCLLASPGEPQGMPSMRRGLARRPPWPVTAGAKPWKTCGRTPAVRSCVRPSRLLRSADEALSGLGIAGPPIAHPEIPGVHVSVSPDQKTRFHGAGCAEPRLLYTAISGIPDSFCIATRYKADKYRSLAGQNRGRPTVFQTVLAWGRSSFEVSG